jgi:4-hydroxy-tetrahydrodipicolinate synthase
MPGIAGPIAAAFTPRGKNNEVDFGASFELLDFLGKSGVQGVALFTASGDYPSVSIEERTRLTYLAVKRSRLPVLACVGSATLSDSLELAREARDAGAEALLLPPPYFYPLDQDDLREFYIQFARRLGTGAPVLVVNTPPLTPAIEIATMRVILESGSYAGVVDIDPAAAGSLATTFLSASDCNSLAARLAGALGSISEAACVAPELAAAMERAFCAGETAKAEEFDAEIARLAGWFAEFPRPAGLKAAAGLRKLKTGAETASPLTEAKRKRMTEFQRWFPEWLANAQELAKRS